MTFPATPLRSEVVVVDTDVVSFLFKQDSRGVRYERHLLERILILSAQSRAELYAWPARRNWGLSRRQDLDLFLLTRFTVEYPDDRLCRIYGDLIAASQRIGRPLPSGDAWQAATAIRLQVPLVTHNASNYAGVPGLLLINEPDRMEEDRKRTPSANRECHHRRPGPDEYR